MDIGRRLYSYFSKHNLLKNTTMAICKALLKHGHSKFVLAIFEYCNQEERIDRENFFLKLLVPQYNVLKIAGLPSIGPKSTETRNKMSGVSAYAYKVAFKDLWSNKVLTFNSLKAACLNLGVDIHSVKVYINGVTLNRRSVKPLLGRFTLLSLGKPKLEANTSTNNSQTLSVIDVTSGDMQPTCYPSVNAFAYAINAHPDNVRDYLRRVKLSVNKQLFYRGKYKIDTVETEGGYKSLPVEIEVINQETGHRQGYVSTSVAAKALGINRKLILNYLLSKNKKPVLGKYLFKTMVNDNAQIVSSNKESANTSKSNSYPMEVINTNTNEVLKFPSLNAVIRELGLSSSSISRFLKGESTKPIKGMYLIKQEGSQLNDISKGLKIEVTNLETNEILKFRSLSEAGRKLGLDPSNMSKHLKGSGYTKPLKGKYLIKKINQKS